MWSATYKYPIHQHMKIFLNVLATVIILFLVLVILQGFSLSLSPLRSTMTIQHSPHPVLETLIMIPTLVKNTKKLAESMNETQYLQAPYLNGI